MGTPNFVKFSRVRGKLWDEVERLERTLSGRWKTELRRAARLRPSHKTYDGGLELEGDIVNCRSIADAMSITEGSKAFGLIYLARPVPAHLYFYFFDMAADAFSFSLSIESSIVYYRNDDFPSGCWLEGVLTSIVCSMGPLVCGYGADNAYQLQHVPLDPDVVLTRLRSGELLRLPRPTFHAISTKLIDKNEIDALIEQYKPSPSPNYRMAPGYHVLGSIGL